MTNELKHVSRAIAVDNLTAIVSNLAEIRQNLAAIEQDTGLLQLHANRLQVLQHRSIFSSSFYKEIVLERDSIYPSVHTGWFVRDKETIEAVAGSMRRTASLRQFPPAIRSRLALGGSHISRGKL